jgi:hypothetical protein
VSQEAWLLCWVDIAVAATPISAEAQARVNCVIMTGMVKGILLRYQVSLQQRSGKPDPNSLNQMSTVSADGDLDAISVHRRL